MKDRRSVAAINAANRATRLAAKRAKNERMAVAARALREGLSHAAAARIAGVHRDTVDRWRSSDEPVDLGVGVTIPFYQAAPMPHPPRHPLRGVTLAPKGRSAVVVGLVLKGVSVRQAAREAGVGLSAAYKAKERWIDSGRVVS